MNKISKMRAGLSTEALEALSHAGGSYPGFVIESSSVAVLADLTRLDVIGPNRGLTILGSGLAGQLQAELLDSLF